MSRPFATVTAALLTGILALNACVQKGPAGDRASRRHRADLARVDALLAADPKTGDIPAEQYAEALTIVERSLKEDPTNTDLLRYRRRIEQAAAARPEALRTTLAVLATEGRKDASSVSELALYILRTDLSAPAAKTRRDAILALRDFPFKGNQALLLRAQTDPDPDVRVEALAALALQGNTAARQALLRSADAASGAGRLRVFHTLRRLGIKPSPESVRHALADDIQDVRTAALLLLAARGDATAQERLHLRFLTRFTRLRAEIVTQLGQADLLRWKNLVTSAIHDPEEEVRLAAARTLAAARDRQFVPSLQAAERDLSWAVRVIATDGLAQLGEETDATFYEKALRDPNWLARQTAAELLAERRGREALPQIRALLNDPDSGVRRTALALAAKLGGRESASLLRETLADRDPFVRDAAAALLLQVTP